MRGITVSTLTCKTSGHDIYRRCSGMTQKKKKNKSPTLCNPWLHSPDLCHHCICQTLMENFTQPLCSEGDIDYSLRLPINHSGNTAWRQLWTERWNWPLMATSCSLLYEKKHWDVAKAMTRITSCFTGFIWRCYSWVSVILCLHVMWFSHWSLL